MEKHAGRLVGHRPDVLTTVKDQAEGAAFIPPDVVGSPSEEFGSDLTSL